MVNDLLVIPNWIEKEVILIDNIELGNIEKIKKKKLVKYKGLVIGDDDGKLVNKEYFYETISYVDYYNNDDFRNISDIKMLNIHLMVHNNFQWLGQYIKNKKIKNKKILSYIQKLLIINNQTKFIQNILWYIPENIKQRMTKKHNICFNVGEIFTKVNIISINETLLTYIKESKIRLFNERYDYQDNTKKYIKDMEELFLNIANEGEKNSFDKYLDNWVKRLTLETVINDFDFNKMCKNVTEKRNKEDCR
jgi:hypothetical protein